MKLYLPNMGTIKSFTEHDDKDIQWHTQWDHTSGGPGERWGFASGRGHYEDDFFETSEEARNEALRRRADRIAYLERRLAQLRAIQEKAEAASC